MPKQPPQDPSIGDQPTAGRKRQHVEFVVGRDVGFRKKTTGLERFDFVHNALPELDYDDIDTAQEFLGVICSMPVLVSSMTGGYAEAESINRALGEACEQCGIPMGVGSQRQALEDSRYLDSFRVARSAAPSIPLFGNIGAAELTRGDAVESVRRLADLIDANGFAVHLNPLQELLQPEGTPKFRAVLSSIERLNAQLGLPVIVKEVGAGLSSHVVRRLLDVGVRIIDVAGAGGTSWAGVELLRREEDESLENEFWDWGIPTSDAVAAARPLCEEHGAMLIASGGVASPHDAAISIALGAHFVGIARPVLAMLVSKGQSGVMAMLDAWQRVLRQIMFLTGSASIDELRWATLCTRS